MKTARIAITLTFICLLALPAFAQAPGAAPSGQDELASAPRIPQAEFKKLLASDSILVIDVRDADAYKAGHIPGAISIPLPELSKHVDELKAEKRPIVAYCA